MPDPRHELGRAAERAVANWLTAHEWRILAARHRSSEGEIDLVALDPGRCLVAVEVRLRSTGRAGEAVGSVRPRHLRRVSAALVAFARTEAIPHDGLASTWWPLAPGHAPGRGG